MIAMTTSSSISVKPERRDFMAGSPRERAILTADIGNKCELDRDVRARLARASGRPGDRPGPRAWMHPGPIDIPERAGSRREGDSGRRAACAGWFLPASGSQTNGSDRGGGEARRVEDGVPARTGRESLASRRKGMRRQPVGTSGTARQAHGLTCQLIEVVARRRGGGLARAERPRARAGAVRWCRSATSARPNHRPRRGGAGRGRRDGLGRIGRGRRTSSRPGPSRGRRARTPGARRAPRPGGTPIVRGPLTSSRHV